MSAVHWLDDIDGDFSTAADWSGGSVPGSSDDAVLNAAGGPFTVTSVTSETVESLQLAANATLDIKGGTFAAAAGTGAGANAGRIVVGNGFAFAVGGAVDNTGAIVLGGGSKITSLLLTSNTSLSGGGVVALNPSGLAANLHLEAAAGAGTVTLTNVDDIIRGGGQIGSGGSGADSLVLVNQSAGTIEALAQDAIFFGNSNISSTVWNSGLIEADYHGVIDAFNADLLGTGGKLMSKVGGDIQLFNCSVSGQRLRTEAGGSITFLPSSADFCRGSPKNAGQINLLGSSLTFSKHRVLSGGGVVQMGYGDGDGGADGGVITGISRSTVLTNLDNTIQGYGALGDRRLTLVNEAGGTIDADTNATMIIDTGGKTIANAGLIETTRNLVVGGRLVIKSALDNTGVLVADGRALIVDGAVSGTGEATIDGTRLRFKSSFNQDVTFTGKSGILKLAQSQTYTASVTGFSASGGASLDLGDIRFVSAGEATFSGTASSGVLTVSDGADTARIHLIGDYLGSTFTASGDGNGGTTVTAGGGDARPQVLTAAMAGLSASSAHALVAGPPSSTRQPLLASTGG